MVVYADHNFLINCANNPEWHAAAIAARDADRAVLVLSPWSIYEIGTISNDRMNELIQVAEALRPLWIMERADLEYRECIHEWHEFWGDLHTEFKPIGTLAEANASLLRCSPDRLAGYSLRDYAQQYQNRGAGPDFVATFSQQQMISAANRVSFASGRLTQKAEEQINRHYVARQLARIKEFMPSEVDLLRSEQELLNTQPIATQIWFFVEFGGLVGMKAHKVESLLTTEHWQTDAILNPNRQVDRQHAVAALPFCDLFVTSDKELKRRCDAIKAKLSFAIAEVQTGEEFIQSLAPEP